MLELCTFSLSGYQQPTFHSQPLNTFNRLKLRWKNISSFRRLMKNAIVSRKF
ncbi:hypothetical protein FDUTEX481_07361 [Tolypothrix sp. PCC 7601]|nr:hypothetical protein FDUTEX481_07361 [Tolypothrix sp. PCC 7601]